MNIDEAQRKKKDLETSIRQLLLEFESTTGLEVCSVEFERYKPVGPVPWGSTPAVGNVEVVVKL